jgi:beta-lactamase regulating signal transducer with metallopeptidase domain
MTELLDLVRHAGQNAGGAATALEILLRVTVLLAAAALVVAGLRRSSAALRHLVWTLSLVGVLLIPPCCWAFPAWQWAVLPGLWRPPATAQVGQTTPEPSESSLHSVYASDVTARQAVESPAAPLATGGEQSPQAAPFPPIAASDTWSGSMALAAVWALGTSMGLVWLVAGVLGAWFVARHAPPAADRSWRQILQQLSTACDSRRPIEVRECPQVSVPMTWGLRRPVILVPAGSAGWSKATKRSVLLHELGHIRRGDSLVQLLGRLACAVYWFHPLVWLAARQMRKTSERAADDAVLSANIAPPEYAEHLVAIAGQMRGTALFGQVALPMASPSDLEGRVLAILDPRRNHRHVQRQTCCALTIAAAIALLPCALLRPGYADDKKSPEQTADPTNPPSDNPFVAGAEQAHAPQKTATAASSPETEKASSAASSSEPSSAKPATTDMIVEGVGWPHAKVGMKREELIEAMGNLYSESPRGVLRWREKHVDGAFHPDSTVLSEVRFNQGFEGALANGLKLGSPGNEILKLYGKPEHVVDRGNGAKEYEYSSKGILFWTNQRKIVQIVVFEPYEAAPEKASSEPASAKPALADAIIEGVGWRYAKVGMKREELIEAMGEPGSESPPGVLRWPDKHVNCCFHSDSKVVSEVWFNEGFPGALANGIKLGSSGHDMLKLYGEPESVVDRNNGAKKYEYSSKGILFWTNQRKVHQIVVFKPYRLAWDRPSPESRRLSTIYRPLPGDDKLSEAQLLYCRYDAKTLGVPDPNRWDNLSAPEKAAAEEKFFQQLSSDQESERVDAIDALVALGSKRAVPPILKIAAERKEKDNWDREVACRALGMLGDRSVVPELVHLTYHFNWNTRQWAQISLVRLTGENFGRDVAAWKEWWEKQGGQPPISAETVTWATSKRLLSMLKGAEDPEKQDELDRQSIEMMKRQLGQ